ncbi:MAG: PP2C family protein-serine/threonine phosphatase [Planctomycetota bacterium]
MKTSPDTSQVLFRREYEHELETWVRRRFTWLCIAYVVLGALGLTWEYLVGPGQPAGTARLVLSTGAGALSLVIVGLFFWRREGHATREDVLRAASAMILALGAVSLASRFLAEWRGANFGTSVIVAIFFWHFTACLFLPWTPRASLRPILPLLAVWALHLLLVERSPGLVERLLQVMFSPGILLRSMHESLFPNEYDDGYVRFQYTYQPMRELGGDFLHMHVGPEGFVHLTVIDVTGHGLAAALTVNRIYGELERIRAETPRARPGELLFLLNRYLRLTMVKHNIYATAIAVTLDPYVGEVCWANAGHPPAFLRLRALPRRRRRDLHRRCFRGPRSHGPAVRPRPAAGAAAPQATPRQLAAVHLRHRRQAPGRPCRGRRAGRGPDVRRGAAAETGAQTGHGEVMNGTTRDADFLAMSARLALRGRGGAEPNPMVGCVIVSPAGEIVGWGYHRRCGGPHAEIAALRRAAAKAAGATAYVTLEPCNHTGRTAPCSEALKR